MERLNETLAEACFGGGIGRQLGIDDCNHAGIQDLVESGASVKDSQDQTANPRPSNSSSGSVGPRL